MFWRRKAEYDNVEIRRAAIGEGAVGELWSACTRGERRQTRDRVINRRTDHQGEGLRSVGGFDPATKVEIGRPMSNTPDARFRQGDGPLLDGGGD